MLFIYLKNNWVSETNLLTENSEGAKEILTQLNLVVLHMLTLI